MMNNRMYIIEQQNRIDELKEELKAKDLKIAELYLKLSKAEGLLNKYMNHVKMNEGREL